ncbi:MAG: hypothetical protein WCC57_17125, partial [Paracoccaceae bacterium]
VPPGQTLHISGCTKGCALPGPATLTLVAQARGFALVRGGSAADTPAQTDLTAEALTAAAQTLFAPSPAESL